MISGNSDPDCNAYLHILKPDNFWNIPKKGPHVSKMGGEQGGVRPLFLPRLQNNAIIIEAIHDCGKHSVVPLDHG